MSSAVNGDPAGGEDEEDESFSSGYEEEGNWIEWFCRLKGNEYFCQVDPSFIEDSFNLTGLKAEFEHYDHALDMILDMDPKPLPEDLQDLVEDIAEQLYGLIHARYIITMAGLQAMLKLYQEKKFGTCPRVLCKSHKLLPCGESDKRQECAVRMYCPRCDERYACKPRYRNIDGAYFGSTFPHLFFLTFPDFKVFDKDVERYLPRVFGYKISPLAYQKASEAKMAEQKSQIDAAEVEKSARNSRHSPAPSPTATTITTTNTATNGSAGKEEVKSNQLG